MATKSKTKEAPPAEEVQDTILDQKPIVVARPTPEQAPSEYIANAKRLEKLQLKLIERATEIAEVFPTAQVRFEAAPGGIRTQSFLTGVDANRIDDCRLEIDGALQQFEEENTRVWMHYLDYIQILKRNEREAQHLEADYKAEVAALTANYNTMKNQAESDAKGFDFCYGTNFYAFIKDQVERKKQPDGTWKSGDKSVSTLYGTVGFRSLPNLVNGKQVTIEDKKALMAHLFELERKATLTPKTVEEKKEAAEAREILDAIKVTFKRSVATEAVFDINDLKAKAEELKLPGFCVNTVSEIGELFIS
jgi:hypothetical protein